MKFLIQWAVRNTPAVNTLVISGMLVGVLCLAQMRREVFPDFALEIILVTVPYPGASPDEVEEGICQKIEEAVRPIENIKRVVSIAQEGSGFVVIELEADVQDVQKVLNEVRSEVDRIPSFPILAEEREVKQITMRQPVISVGVLGPDRTDPDAELELREVAERVRDDLLQQPAVSQATIVGAREFQIDVEIPEDTLRKYGLTLQRVAEIIRRQNVEIPGGTMRTDSQEVLLRGKNKRTIGEDILDIPLITAPGGVVLSVGDVGTVRDEFDDSITSISRINGRPGLAISVERTTTEDLLAMVDDVNRYVATADLPAGYKLVTWNDQSVEVRDRLNMLATNAVQGLILVFLLLAVFLDLRLAFWVSLGIPVAILGTCAVLFALGHTLNELTTFGFLMVLGMLVDDAIVVGENVYEHRQRGKSFAQAAIDGTFEVLPSITSSVLTTVVAFIPLMYVSGVMGKFVGVLPVAVIAALMISLAEATFSLPCHLSHAPSPLSLLDRTRRWRSVMSAPLAATLGRAMLGLVLFWTWLTYPLARVGDLFARINVKVTAGFEWTVANVYRPSARWAVDHAGVTLAAAVSLLLVSFGLIVSGYTPFNVFPQVDSKLIVARIMFPDGTPAAVTNAATDRIEKAILAINERLAQQGEPVVRYVHRAVGQVSSPGAMGPDTRTSGSQVGGVNVELVEPSQRTIHSRDIIAQWREASGQFPGAESVTFNVPDFGPGGRPIEFRLLADSRDMSRLEAAIEETKARLTQYAGVFDVADDSRPGKWEFQLKVKPSAMAMGVPLADLAETVRASYYGEEVMRLQRGRHEVKLMVRYPQDDRRSLADFEEIRVRTNDGAERPITEMADVQVARGYAEINRIDQLRAIAVTADVDESVANAFNIVQDLRTTFMPGLLAKYPGVRVLWEGQQERTTESMESLRIGLVVAMMGMFVLLTVEFRSYVQPLMVLAIIPFGITGAVLGHFVQGMEMTMFSLFGLVALTGVVVNDSIVLIDFINHRVNDGMPLKVALVDAGAQRLRPIFLTSVTTIAGLLPILLEQSLQAQIVIPMATSLCFGLMVATVLVPYLVPTMYYVYALLTGIGAAAIDESGTLRSTDMESWTDDGPGDVSTATSSVAAGGSGSASVAGNGSDEPAHPSRQPQESRVGRPD
ncbi:MAG: efflux RND transporter permease subunit [Pirellulales bacterium]